MFIKAIHSSGAIKDKFIAAFIEMKGQHIADLLDGGDVMSIDFDQSGEMFLARFNVVVGEIRLAAQVLSESPFVAIAKAADEMRDKIMATLYERNFYA